MMGASRQKGFMLIELIISISVLCVVLVVAFNLMQLTFKLQDLGIKQSSVLQNQTLVMQRIQQQVAIYGRSVSIQTGETDRLVVNDIAGNRIVAFYKGNDTETGTAVLYMSIQSPPESAGANQLSDPYNVEVIGFKVRKLDNKRIRAQLEMREKHSNKIWEYVDIVTMINGEVL